MGATDLLPLSPLLKGILWVEVIVYFGIGVYEIVDDFWSKPPSWSVIKGKPNSYVLLCDKVGHKMHACVCFLLGFIALNGLIEGAITRFELELCFLSLALLMMTIWMTWLPGRLGITVITLTKPEFWLQILMMIYFADLIRSWLLGLCISLNLWGLLVWWFHTRRGVVSPFSHETLRADSIVARLDDASIKGLDRLAGYRDSEVDA